MHWALLLLACAPLARGSIDAGYYYLADPSACDDRQKPLRTYQAFGASSGPIPPVQIDSVTNEFILSYPASVQSTYTLEGVRSSDYQCSYCAVGIAPELPPTPFEFLAAAGTRSAYFPMLGPCFDGAAAAANRMSCVQNELLYPPSYCGEYFFPNQILDAWAQRGYWNPLFLHSFVEGESSARDITTLDANGNPLDPSAYALGKASVQQYLSQMQIVSRADTSRVNQTATDALQAPYKNFPNGTERWPRFAQHFCRFACHRDSLWWQTRPSTSDVLNDTRQIFLNRIDAGTNEQALIIRCVKCPPYYRAYQWGTVLDKNAPEDPRLLIVSFNCWPQFGAIPRLAVSTVDPTSTKLLYANATVSQHGLGLDGVAAPTATLNVQALVCGVNTYNNKCTHAYVYGGQGVPTACTPCPPGYHTAGQVGAWYCLPPPGQTIALAPGSATLSPRRNVLTLFRDAQTNISLLWARRDLLGYEWECGFQPTHCWQCAQYGLPASALPDDFNQAMILAPLLLWQACPSGYYCPTALDAPPIPCPASLPWSPPGASSLANCTCAARTYRSGPNACTPCPSPNATCATGWYLAGNVRCLSAGGATSGGMCVPCTNKPANAAYLPWAGQEVANGSAAYFGVCPFECPRGTQLSGANAGCSGVFACAPVTALYLNGGSQRVYAAALQNYTDQFLTATSACPLSMQLSNKLALAAASSTLSLPVSASCMAASPGACASPDVSCYVVQPATFYSDYVCAPCPPPPSNSTIVPEALALNCNNIQCKSGYFYNASSGACESCLAAEARVGCPAGSHLRGGGCYGYKAAFPQYTDLAALAVSNCKICQYNLATLTLDPGQFLNVAPAGGGSCAIQACARANGVTQYVAIPCGGTSDSVLADCVTSCPAGYWLQGVCSPTTTPVCRPCTTSKPGAYNVSGCGATSDAVWVPCGVDAANPQQFTPGLFCPGSGPPQPCPYNKTSVSGAKSEIDCFCPVGTALAGDGLSCQAFRCADARVDTSAPGAGHISASYMTLSGTDTVCASCGGGLAYSQGDGIGDASCVCPGGYYYVAQGQTCAPCPSTPATCVGGGYTAVSDVCWTGQTRSVTTCACLAPPFAALTGCASATACATGFDLVLGLDGGSKPDTLPTGSAMHVLSGALGWDLFFQHDPSLHEDGSVTNGYALGDLVATSDYWDPASTAPSPDGWGSPDNYQYAVWILAQPGLYDVYAAPLPSHRAVNYDPYLHDNAWSVLPSAYARPSTLLRLAVAQWPVAQTPARIVGGNSVATDVGVVVRDDASGTLYLYHNTLKVDLIDTNALGAALWGPDASASSLNLTVPAGAACVGMGHAYAVPGGAATGLLGTFYVAASTPAEGAVVGVRTLDASLFALRGLPPLTAMTLLARPDGLGVNLYLVQPGVDNVRLVEWNSASGHGAVRDELFFTPYAPSARIRALLPLVWPTTLLTPTFLALAEEPLGGVDTADPILHAGQPRLRILTADATQRTLTQVQGMPPLTRPSLLAATGMGVGAALLLAAAGSDLYTLDVGVCAARAAGTGLSMVPTYWDGAQCLTHVCVRASACKTDSGQMWDPRTLRCVCTPGYWMSAAATQTTDLACQLCVSGYYCPGNGTSLQCPYGTATSPSGATAATDCLCRVGQYYDASAKRCLACAAGAWCPNQWTALPCPGANDASLNTGGGLPFPTSCLCRSGYSDVRCAACPAPFVCPTNTQSQISNNAFALTLGAGVSADPCPDVLWPKLATYLSATRIGYLTRPDQLVGRLSCTFVPAPPDRTGVPALAVVEVQTELADAANGLITNMPTSFRQQFFADSAVVTGFTTAQVYAQKLANNTPVACAAGRAPTAPDPTTCVCAPGFATDTNGACTQCGAGQYKPGIGPGTCAACPVGATSPVGASVCVSSGGGAHTNATAGGGGVGSTTTLIIVGSVGGGIVVVGLLVWLFMSVCAE